MSARADAPLVERIARAHADLRPRLRGGPAWQARRDAALSRLLQRGLPDRRDENWKYLDWPEVLAREFAPVTAATAEAPTPAGLELPGACRIVTVDGRYSPALSDRSLPAGVSVEELGAALDREPELAARLRVPGEDADDRFALLAEAFTDAGALVRIAANADVQAPIHLLHIATGAAASHARLVVEAGTNSRARILEQFLGGGDGALSNLAVEVTVGAGAQLVHMRLHEQPAGAAHVETLSVTQAADSRYRQQSFILGGRVLRSGLRLELAGRGAECEVEGLFMVEGIRQADIYTVIDHLAPHTRTVETFRGVASDRGRGSFNGRIVVHEGAVKADSQQSSRNLILTPLAEINARPQLEILTDDVKCSHGTTIGSLDPQQLFYLLSRGIDPAVARGLLTFAFCEDVVARIPWPEARRHVEELVVGRLPDRDIIREFV
ncbi:MAG: Fe-S cluster assembly protein SufD [Steroidobacteraceae bacterium]|jgi:Fe-S cluster assembly protein SufD|nr:Fe-S cluster assembly protein SufD [Steroidobacteraceae bacterium]